MAISFDCDHCNRPLEVDDEAAGQFADCPHCRRVVPVPPGSQQTNVANNVAVHEIANPNLPSAHREFSSGPPAPHFGKAAFVSIVVAQVCVCVLMYLGLSDAQAMQATDGVDISAIDRGILIPLLYFGAVGGGSTAMFAAIVSLSRKETPRWPAVVSLCLIMLFVGLFTGMMMLSVLFGASI